MISWPDQASRSVARSRRQPQDRHFQIGGFFNIRVAAE